MDWWWIEIGRTKETERNVMHTKNGTRCQKVASKELGRQIKDKQANKKAKTKAQKYVLIRSGDIS